MISKAKAWQIRYATSILRDGGIVAHATEAVWGLACDPTNSAAVERLLTLKRRPEEKGLILVSGQKEHFADLLSLLPGHLVDRFNQRQNQPTTWLVPDPTSLIPKWIKGRHVTVAVRLSQHPTISALSKSFGCPLVTTSANPAGRVAARDLRKVNQYFGSELDYLLSSSLGGFSKPSEIRDLVTGGIARA